MSSRSTVPLPTPMTSSKRRPARFVAHVRTVGQVVGPESTGQQLVDERGLVARSSARVESRMVRCGERPEAICDQREGVIPTDRGVVIRTGCEVHGLREPAVVFECVRVVVQEVAHGVGSEELSRDAIGGRLPRRRFRAIFAELGHLSVFGMQGRATRSSDSRTRPRGSP